MCILKALRSLEGAPVAMIQVCGAVSSEDKRAQEQTARLTAEFARELSLIVFNFR